FESTNAQNLIRCSNCSQFCIKLKQLLPNRVISILPLKSAWHNTPSSTFIVFRNPMILAELLTILHQRDGGTGIESNHIWLRAIPSQRTDIPTGMLKLVRRLHAQTFRT